MRAYPMELRERVVDRAEGTWAATAAGFRVSVGFVGNLLRQRRETGSVEPRRGWTGSPPALDGRAIGRLKGAVESRPVATLDELRRRARLSCGRTTVFRHLSRLGYSRKRVAPGSRTGPRGRAARPAAVRPLDRPRPPAAAGVPRRDRRPDRPDPHARQRPEGGAGRGRGAARPVDDGDGDRRRLARRPGRPVRVRGASRRGRVPDLRREGARVRAAAGGRGRHGQPQHSQGGRGGRGDPPPSAAARSIGAVCRALGDALDAVTRDDCHSGFMRRGY